MSIIIFFVFFRKKTKQEKKALSPLVSLARPPYKKYKNTREEKKLLLKRLRSRVLNDYGVGFN
jgi:hypothetical protein